MAPNLSTGPKAGQKRTESIRMHPNGFPLPRIETKPRRDVTGTYGPRCREWAERTLGIELRGWQAYAVDRALEHDAAGALVWSEVLLTVARQSGKSTLARIVVLWRMHEGPELFAQDQLVISAANKLPTAWEVMLPALRSVKAEHGDDCVREGNNRPGIAITLPKSIDPPPLPVAAGPHELTETVHGQVGFDLPQLTRPVRGPVWSSRWVPVAAVPGAGTGYSTTMLFVDEVWDIADRVVDDDLEPTLAEAESGQIWLTSTAGDSGSTLFATRRGAAIEQLSRDESEIGESDRVLILEWSAPPDADVDDETTWLWASPEWSDKRVRFLREKHRKSKNIDSFRTQYLNQWVRKIDGWLNSRTYAATLDPTRPLPAAAEWTVVVEMARDGSSHAIATAATDEDGRVVVRLVMARTYRDVDEVVARIRAEHQATKLRTTPFYRGRLTSFIDGIVGSSEVGAATAELLRVFREHVIAHDGAPVLEEHLFASDVRKLEGVYKLISGSVDVDAHGARAVLFAVWLASAIPAPAPMIASRKRK